MIAGTGDGFSSQVRRSRLEILFNDISSAVEADRFETAFRLADRACRVAPENPTCALVRARLLTQLGAASAAAQQLKDAQSPDTLLALMEALCAQGLLGDATAICNRLLTQFALGTVEGLQHFARKLCRLRSDAGMPGWVGVDCGLRLVGEVRSGMPVSVECGRRLHPVECIADQDGFTSFACEVPAGVSGRLAVSSGAIGLLGTGPVWPLDVQPRGWVALESKTLIGEAQCGWAPKLPVTLAIGQKGGKYFRVPVTTTVCGSFGSPFAIPLETLDPTSDFKLDHSPIEISIVLPDGRHAPLPGSPVWAQSISPVSIGVRPQRTFCSRQNAVATLAESLAKPKIDIIIPVYSGLEETIACLESVLRSINSSEAEVVVVNDASPDIRLCKALSRLADDGCITLLANDSNMGFPGAANQGIRLHSERDVVLLNADTEVSGDWLARLRAAASCADDVGTATPLGEFASIATYPGTANPIYTTAEAVEIDAIAREVNVRKVVELPVGVGFCMYIRRACLAEVGCLDERLFAQGYGEENDFCLRARRLGWRHLAATDVFVRHHGGRSYGNTKKMLMERNRRVLNSLHPGYDEMIAAFIAADPLLEARRAIDIRRLLEKATNPLLLVTLDLPGGVKRHVDDRAAQLKKLGHMVLVLKPLATTDGRNQVILNVQDLGIENLIFSWQDLTILRDVLTNLRLQKIEIHHFVGLPPPALELVVEMGLSYDVYIHDYSWICPRVTLVGGAGTYCGEPPIEGCERCILAHGTALEESLTVQALRARSARILDHANKVVAPSNDVRLRLARYFPDIEVEVIPWEETICYTASRMKPLGPHVRIAVIGAISIQKGYQVLLECARDAASRNLNLEFVVIGYTHDDDLLLETEHVFITGPYSESEIDALLLREQCHAAFFPSVAPETWCYTLTHALRKSLPVIAFDLGAIAERVCGYAPVKLLPLAVKPADINDVMMHFVRHLSTSIVQKESRMNTSLTNNNSIQEVSASVQVLNLPVGVYAFTVQSGAPTTISTENLALPALQVGLAPMKSSGKVEFLSGGATSDRWLARSTDMIIVRIVGDNAALLLTSLRSPGSSVLAIDVRRLDSNLQPVQQMSQANQSTVENDPVLQTQILVHIRNVGDVSFDRGWAGCTDDNLWLEGFVITCVGNLAPNLIEYCGITADGSQTPWLTNQMLCGSRGRGMPLIGYAVRLKPAIVEHYDCAYSGKFMSGKVFGPFKDSELCCSDIPGDPLQAIELQLAGRGMALPQILNQEIALSNES